VEKFSPCPPGLPGERRWFPAKGGGFSFFLFLMFGDRWSRAVFFSFFQYNSEALIELVKAFVAQLVERSLGKTEVSGSIPDKGSQLT
jgi:hypothetical protein